MTVTLLPTTAEHVRVLATRMRVADMEECEAAGLGADKALWRSWRRSAMATTAFVDDDLAAIWGVGGCPLGSLGRPWLLTTEACERVPLAFVRVGRAEVAKMLYVFPRLLGYVDARYWRAVRFLALCGFEISDTFRFGPREMLFRSYEMRRD